MAKGIMVVRTSPADPSQEADYNEWYDQVHIPQILQIPGFVSAQRYELLDPEGTSTEPAYLAIYELEGDDVMAPVAALGAKSAAGEMTSSDALRRDPPPVVTLYQRRD